MYSFLSGYKDVSVYMYSLYY